MKMKRLNKKGFTLVELLAVIVILALIMAIAVVSMGGIMQTARENTFKDTAISIINGVKQQLALEGRIGSSAAGDYFFTDSILEKGGKTSPLGGEISYATVSSNKVGSYDVSQIGKTGIYKVTSATAPSCGASEKSFINVTYNSTTNASVYTICLTAGANNPYISSTEANLSKSDVDVILGD